MAKVFEPQHGAWMSAEILQIDKTEKPSVRH